MLPRSVAMLLRGALVTVCSVLNADPDSQLGKFEDALTWAMEAKKADINAKRAAQVPSRNADAISCP
mgnify:CR=1 FL=1